MERYRRAVRGNPQNSATYKERLKKQVVISAVIFLSVFCIGLLKTETANVLKERISEAVSYTVDYQWAAKEFVNMLFGFVKEVKNAF